MYITYSNDESQYCLHIDLASEIPEEIDIQNFLIFENDAHVKEITQLFLILSQNNMFLRDWYLSDYSPIYGFINGEVVLRIDIVR